MAQAGGGSPGFPCRLPGRGDQRQPPGGQPPRNPFQGRPRWPYCGAVTTQVIVLNGGSSSGKSGIARCLQAVLPGPWLTLGTDTLVDAMPASLQTSDGGIEFAPDGEVVVGPQDRKSTRLNSSHVKISYAV